MMPFESVDHKFPIAYLSKVRDRDLESNFGSERERRAVASIWPSQVKSVQAQQLHIALAIEGKEGSV